MKSFRAQIEIKRNKGNILPDTYSWSIQIFPSYLYDTLDCHNLYNDERQAKREAMLFARKLNLRILEMVCV